MSKASLNLFITAILNSILKTCRIVLFPDMYDLRRKHWSNESQMPESCTDLMFLAVLTYAENFCVDKKGNGASSDLF